MFVRKDYELRSVAGYQRMLVHEGIHTKQMHEIGTRLTETSVLNVKHTQTNISGTITRGVNDTPFFDISSNDKKRKGKVSASLKRAVGA